MLKVYSRNLGNAAVLCLQGRLISGETGSLRDAVRSQSKVSAVVLDLARVTAIDARGLGVMLELQRQTALEGIRLKLMNVNKFTSRVLELTRLDSVFEIIPKAEADRQNASHEVASAHPAIRRARIAACA